VEAVERLFEALHVCNSLFSSMQANEFCSSHFSRLTRDSAAARLSWQGYNRRLAGCRTADCKNRKQRIMRIRLSSRSSAMTVRTGHARTWPVDSLRSTVHFFRSLISSKDGFRLPLVLSSPLSQSTSIKLLFYSHAILSTHARPDGSNATSFLQIHRAEPENRPKTDVTDSILRY